MILSWVYSTKKDFVSYSLDMSQPIISHIYHHLSSFIIPTVKVPLQFCTQFPTFVHFSKGTQDGMETCDRITSAALEYIALQSQAHESFPPNASR